MSRVYTTQSSIFGRDVFSSAHFSRGEIILKIDDFRVVTDADPLDPANAKFEHHCDYLNCRSHPTAAGTSPCRCMEERRQRKHV
jgi:hypothetical protein